MKKVISLSVLLLSVFFLIPFYVSAQQNVVDEISFAWEDGNADKTPGYGWKIYVRDEGSMYNYASPFVTIPWDGINPDGTFQGGPYIITAFGDPGTIINKYFVCRAFDSQGNISNDSNEASYALTIGSGPSPVVNFSIMNFGISEGTTPPTVSFTANPIEVAAGQNTTLAWDVVGARTVIIGNELVSHNGSMIVSPSATTTYTLTSIGDGGTTVKSAIVKILPPTASITADPEAIILGESSTLNWNVAGADIITIDNEIGTVAPVGSIQVNPSETTDYILTATGAGGVVTATATIVVEPPRTPEILFFDADPEEIAVGESTNLDWGTIFADTVTIDNGIGPVPVNGNVVVTPSITTTYTLTATGVSSETYSVTVFVSDRNDFSLDPGVVSLFKLDDGFLIDDSKGTNTLTNAGGVTSDTVNFKEGSSSSSYISSSSQYLYRADADLSANFPLKNGSSNRLMSITGWVRFNTANEFYSIVGKHSGATSRTFRFGKEADANGNTFHFTGTSANNSVQSTVQPTTNTWYHFGVTYDANTGAVMMIIRPDGGVAVETTGNIGIDYQLGVADFRIGAQNTTFGMFNGQIDEVVVFNRIITANEIDQIYSGTYKYVPPPERHDFEAESGTVTPNMQKIAGTASGGFYVAVPTSAANSTGRVDYNINITDAGEYIITGLVSCAGAANNSFTVEVDGIVAGEWHTAISTPWIWDAFGDRTGADSDSVWPTPIPLQLSSGNHTISLLGREKETRIDKLIIIKDVTFNPRP